MSAVARKQAIEVLTANFSNATSVAVVAALVDKSKLTFNASAVYTDGSDTVTATVCSANGKVKLFNNIDDIVRECSPHARG